MKKQIISALCAAIAFCLSFASCGAANQVEKRTTAQTTSEAVTTTAAPRSILADRDPAADYAIDPPLELYDNNEIAVFPDYFHRFEYIGEEAVEVIAMLNIVNALTAEQISEPNKPDQDPKSHKEWYYDWFTIEFTHNNILYNISAGVRTDGTATFGLLEHDLTTDKQTQRYSFHFQNNEWTSLIESVRAQIPQ